MTETTNAKYTIRYATEADIPVILALIHELAAYEHASDHVHATPELLASTLSFPTSTSTSTSTSKVPNFTPGYARTLLISSAATTTSTSTSTDEEIAGFAVFFTNYSTWRAAPGLYLEDLFIRPPYRKRGRRAGGVERAEME
ncbi:hypothetical protein DV736_g4662, partial [Chaetothyriales sp. CBS 134916]